MASYTVTAETDYDDLSVDQAQDIVEALEGHRAVVVANDAGHFEVILHVDAPCLQAAAHIALLLVDHGPVPELRSLVVEPSESFDDRVEHRAMVEEATGALLAEARADHPAFTGPGLAVLGKLYDLDHRPATPAQLEAIRVRADRIERECPGPYTRAEAKAEIAELDRRIKELREDGIID